MYTLISTEVATIDHGCGNGYLPGSTCRLLPCPRHYSIMLVKLRMGYYSNSDLYAYLNQGGHSHRYSVPNCDHGQNVVKGSKHFLGICQAVFWPLSPAPLVVKGHDRDFTHAQLINDQRVKDKNSPSGQSKS
jgi:hypothetical protein